MNIVILKKGKEKKVLNRYQWIFKDDIREIMGDPQSGDVVNVLDENHTFIAKAFYNDSAKIPLRVIALHDAKPENIIKVKIEKAVAKRNDLFYGRMVFAEADFIPGLIVDRYGDYLALQIRNPGLLAYAEVVKDILVEILHPKGIILRNDFETLRDANLKRGSEVIYGSVPEEIIISENGYKFYVDLYQGQKTGYFYDQRDNRKIAVSLITEGMQALDLYTYTGSFAIHMAGSGAAVIAVDKSKDDLLTAKRNAELNGLKNDVEFIASDVLSFLRQEKREYDVIVCDPPGLAKKKSELKNIKTHLVDIGVEMLRILKPGGQLVLFGCSHLMQASFLTEVLKIAASVIKKPLFLKYTTHQPPDHPILLQMPETAYLTGVWVTGG